MRKEVTEWLKTLVAGFVVALALFLYPKSEDPRWILEAALLLVLLWVITMFGFLSSRIIRGGYELFQRVRSNKRFRYITLKDIDQMEGDHFEAYIAYFLRLNGFKRIKITQYQGDQGIDIIAHKKKESYGIQCKRWSRNVGNSAVQETYAGQGFYKLDHGLVITNSFYTQSAKSLAAQLNIELIDRNDLIDFLKTKGARR